MARAGGRARISSHTHTHPFLGEQKNTSIQFYIHDANCGHRHPVFSGWFTLVQMRLRLGIQTRGRKESSANPGEQRTAEDGQANIPRSRKETVGYWIRFSDAAVLFRLYLL